MKTKLLLFFLVIFSLGNSQVTNGLIQEWKFNNSRNNEANNLTFVDNGFSGFATDRHGDANQALQFNDRGTGVAISNLPVGSSARSVSIWIKMINYQNSPTECYAFSYGGTANNSAYGMKFLNASGTIIVSNYAIANDYAAAIVAPVNTWHHYVTVYDGTTAKVYVDGAAVINTAKSWNTTTNMFRIGVSNTGANSFQGVVDDLKIYDRALSAAEVSSLFSGTTLATTENSVKNTETSIYPNPAKDFVNIQSENKVKSVEIYNMAGQKVLEAKETKINTSNLKSGVYMVKIIDVKNNFTNKKLIIK